MNASPIDYKSNGTVMVASLRIIFGPKLTDTRLLDCAESIDGRDEAEVKKELRERLAGFVANCIKHDLWGTL